LAGAVEKSQATALTFEAADAAAGFWSFFPGEKGLGPAAMSGINSVNI